MNMEETTDRKQAFVHKNGVTYFSKRTERRVLFLMTMAMLVWGIVEYAGILF
ncbi:hypothetical protein DND132_1329 [Pseudodesulfovibrio mercurii]|uniref:Uncharacterized protein n=1 Tax=Pseudodesulfovibrio mercurii TaxID=641491 RepID=F0JD46_9BACT|nr:hypothetical protein [Pseudodesulfovibrio mercurii]EGB14538.1 hypothetical protein DND132_1329 [Pseudodesulfovibrio mercurii]